MRKLFRRKGNKAVIWPLVFSIATCLALLTSLAYTELMMRSDEPDLPVVDYRRVGSFCFPRGSVSHIKIYPDGRYKGRLYENSTQRIYASKGLNIGQVKEVLLEQKDLADQSIEFMLRGSDGELIPLNCIVSLGDPQGQEDLRVSLVIRMNKESFEYSGRKYTSEAILAKLERFTVVNPSLFTLYVIPEEYISYEDFLRFIAKVKGDFQIDDIRWVEREPPVPKEIACEAFYLPANLMDSINKG